MTIPPTTLIWLIPLILWEAAWKGVGLWKSARNGHMPWFICILVFNTLGILPMVYLKFFQDK